MKIILKKKDGTTQEISVEQAQDLIKNKKASLDEQKCRVEKIIEDGTEVLNIFAPNLGKLIKAKEPNK